MNWYSRLKTAAMESEWWVRFYEHLSKTAQFVLNGNGMQVRNDTFSSGVDGSRLFFMFVVVYKNYTYRCNITLEFANRLSNTQWQNSNLVSLQESGESLVKAEWFIIATSMTDRSEYHIAGRGYLLPPKALPNSIMQAIKQSILADGEDDGGPSEQEPTPDPSRGLELEVPQYV